MPAYTVIFSDLLSNIPKAELPLNNIKYGYLLNGAGNFSASISVRHPKATQDVLDEGKTAIFIDRDGEVVWGGVLWQSNVNAGPSSATIDLTGLEFWSLFQDIGGRGRYIRDSHTYTDVDQLTIVQSLITYAQNTGVHGPSADYGIQIGGQTSGVLRTQTYNSWERTAIGTAVENMAALDNGFDFRIRCRRSGGTIIKELLLFYPTTPGGGLENLSYEWGRNILSYTYPIDALQMAKKVDALGAGEGAQMLIATAEDTGLTTYPMRETDYAYKDVTQTDTLLSHAISDLVRNRLPDAIPTLIVKTSDDAPIGSFFPGNTAYVRVDDGKVQIDDVLKITQQEVRVDTDGHEEMTVRFNTADEASA